MAASRPKSSTSSPDESDNTWLLIAGAAVLVVGAGALYALLSSGKKDEPKPVSRKPKTLPKPKAAAAEAPAAADPASDPTPVEASPAPAPAAASASASDAEPTVVDLDFGSAAGADAGALAEALPAPAESVLAADGTVTKEGLVTILRGLTERISARRVELQKAVDAGEMDSSDFQRALGQAIPELETETNAHFGVDPEAVFNAQSKYQESPEVIEVSRGLRNAALPDFASKAMGDMEDVMSAEGTVPEGMTEAKVVQMTIDNASATIAKMKELVAEVKADGLTGADALQAFQQRFVNRAKEFTVQTFESLGVSPQDYAACMMKFVESPAVQRAHQETHQRLAVCQQLNMMELTSGMSREDAMATMGIEAGAKEFF